MKRFCLDSLVVVLSMCFMLCVAAIPEGVLPLVPLLAVMMGLGVAIRAAHRESLALEEAARTAKREKRRRAIVAKRQRACVSARAKAASTAAATAAKGLSVA